MKSIIMMQEIYGEGTQSKTTGQQYCEIEEDQSDVESLNMQEVAYDLVTLMEEKEDLATEVAVLSATLMKKIEHFDLVSQELTQGLIDQTNRQQQVISNTCKELDLVKGELKGALQQIQVNEMEINRLNKHLELQTQKLKEADDEQQKKTVAVLSQATRNDLSLPEAKEKEKRKQMQAVILLLVHALSEQFTQLECKVTEDINANNSRLSSLIEKADMLTNVGLQYKQRLEKRYSDLKMAEAEEQDFQGEVEAVVMQSLITSIQEEFEEKLREQNAMFCDSQSVNWLEKFNEISSLRKELDVILKLLPNHETGQLVSLGSGDVDHSHRKVLNNHIPFSNPHWEGNGKVGDPETGVLEVFDAAHIKHLSRDELVKHFNTMMRDSKRDHESTVQRMVEEIISLKGKILNERGSSLPSRKDKEFDILKKKIPEVILKLDGIIVDNEKLPALCDSTLGSLKDRLDSLLVENNQLRDLLTDKKNEAKCLSSQVSEAEEKMLQHSSSEKNFLRLLANLNSSLEDTSIEASVREEVYKCVLRELTDRIKSDSEESEIKSIIMQEIYGIIYGEGTQSKTTGQCEIEESDMESLIIQEMCGCIFRECIKDATGQLKELYLEYLTEKESRVSLERKVLEKEKKLRSEVVGNDSLKQEVAHLVTLMEEKEKLATEVSATLMKKIEQFDLASQELTELRDHTNRQQQVISNTFKDLDLVKGELKKALEQIEVNEMEINSLNKHLELQMHKLEEADEQKKMIVALTQATQNDLLLLEAKEKEQRKQMQAVILLVHALSEQFTQLECKVTEDINANNSRLIYSTFQLSSLIEKAKMLTNVGLQYKQRLERRCCDLKMAEAEVDLLGDEVETLSSLLEKIYIALDHYSPILQHYPGIIEILKLVRRELSGETCKSV